MYHLALVSKKLVRLGRPFLNPLNTRAEFDWIRNIPQQKTPTLLVRIGVCSYYSLPSKIFKRTFFGPSVRTP